MAVPADDFSDTSPSSAAVLPGWTRGALTWSLNAHFVVGSVAIVEDGDGGVLLARLTYRRPAPWALPGGWVRRGEDPSDTIVREILEETGLTVEVLRLRTVQRESPRHLTVVYAACHHAAPGISSGSNSAPVKKS